MAVELFARCVRGLEWVVAAEAAAALGATVTGVRHREVGLAVDRPDPVSSGSGPASAALLLRTADDVFVLVGRVDCVGRPRSALATVSRSVRRLGAAFHAAAALRPGTQPGDFEVVASFLGKRNYNRFDLEDAVGEAAARATGWRYQTRRGDQRPDVTRSVRVHVEDDLAVIGLRWAERPLHRRDYKVGDWLGTLHPPVAAAMALIAGGGRRVVDPFCGAGTIVVESLLAADPAGSALGSDVSPDAIAHARANAERAGVNPELSVAVADAAHPPWRLTDDDVVVTNPPWGRAVSPSGALHTSADVLAAVVRLTTDQRSVVLIDDPDLELADHAALAVPLSLFGSHPLLAVLDPAGVFPSNPALAEAHAAHAG
jgi:23S rRNA G2445 N2-methylase RlmL